MTVVVLGWDGLDWQLAGEFGLRERFGTHTTRLTTISNPELGKPHTYEIWPTIITGLRPETHGLQYGRQVGSQWSNPLLNLAEKASRPIPDSVRWRIGRWIRSAGAGFEFETLDYYAENGFETIFDGRRSLPLAIPNARSAYDDELGIEMDRGSYLADFLNVTTAADGTTRHEPAISPDAFCRLLEADVGRKLGAVRAASHQDFDLIFVWLAYLDTMGHVAPTVDDPERWTRVAYRTAAELTADIRYSLATDDTLICISDHGLRDGEHTEDAFYGQFHPDASIVPTSVLEAKHAIAALSPQAKRRDDAHSASERVGGVDGVRENLRDLGYID